MKTNDLLTATLFCCFALVPTVVDALEMDNAIVVEAELRRLPDELVITGRGFDEVRSLDLTLGGIPLEVLERSPTRLIAELPRYMPQGTYVLIAWSGRSSIREDAMDVTIPADGSKGAFYSGHFSTGANEPIVKGGAAFAVSGKTRFGLYGSPPHNHENPSPYANQSLSPGRSCTARNLVVKAFSPPGEGISWTFTLQRHGRYGFEDTVVSCTITGTDFFSQCESDNTQSLTANSKIAFKYTSTGYTVAGNGPTVAFSWECGF